MATKKAWMWLCLITATNYIQQCDKVILKQYISVKSNLIYIATLVYIKLKQSFVKNVDKVIETTPSVASIFVSEHISYQS